MKYTVLWAGAAENALVEIWLRATDRQSVTVAAQAIDRALELDPEEVGESREFNQRVVLVPPLGLVYIVRPSDALVRILRVWEVR